MNIAIDIDDTLMDSFDYFQKYVAEFFGVGLAEVRRRKCCCHNTPPKNYGAPQWDTPL